MTGPEKWPTAVHKTVSNFQMRLYRDHDKASRLGLSRIDGHVWLAFCFAVIRLRVSIRFIEYVLKNTCSKIKPKKMGPSISAQRKSTIKAHYDHNLIGKSFMNYGWPLFQLKLNEQKKYWGRAIA